MVGAVAAVTDATARSFDDGTILAWIATYAGLPGVDPSVASDPTYWKTRIQQTGGLGDDNKGYWVERFYGQGGDTPDGLSLDPGPLTPLDPIDLGLSASSPTQFADLVNEHLAPLDGTDTALDSAGQAVVTFDGAADVADSGASDLDAGAAAHADTVTALAGENMDAVVGATDGHSAAVDDHAAPYADPPPSGPAIPDPLPPPEKGQPGEPGGPPAA
jgi:hypothetical protein